MAETEELKPGEFRSDIPGHGGTIRFPAPFLHTHFEAWWKIAVEGKKGLNKLDLAYFNTDWEAARELIVKYGDWRIEGVTTGDLSTGTVPEEVVAWVLACADDYIAPRIALKKLLLPSIAALLESQ